MIDPGIPRVSRIGKLIADLKIAGDDNVEYYLTARCEVCLTHLTIDDKIHSANEKTLGHCTRHCEAIKKQMAEFMESMAEYGAS